MDKKEKVGEKPSGQGRGGFLLQSLDRKTAQRAVQLGLNGLHQSQ